MCVSLCFPASASVWTRTGAQLIPNLEISNKLQRIKLSRLGKPPTIKTDTFYTYLHYDAEQRAEFLVLKIENGAELRLSGDHLIFCKNEAGTLTTVPARDIRIGHSLIYITKEEEVTNSKVVDIGRVVLTGVYAPLTESGSLIVDGFLVSCYAGVESHAKAHALLAPLRLWYRNKIRMSTMLKTKSASKRLNHVDGIHDYAKFWTEIRSLSPKLEI